MNKNNPLDKTQLRLNEMPELGGSYNTFNMLNKEIEDFRHFKKGPEDLGNGLKKIHHDGEVFYWYEVDGQVQLGVIMNDKPQHLEVTLLGKNPQWKGQPPYATDLYAAILKDQPTAKIFSDVELSIQGFKFWSNMVRAGYNVSVYDTVNKKYIKIKDIRDFNRYTGPESLQRYRYVLSRSTNDIQSLNEVQRIAKLAGAPRRPQ